MKTEIPYRFGAPSSDGRDAQYRYPDVWSIETTTGPSRLVAAPSARHVDCLIELSREVAEPFGILLVMLIPRLGSRPGRYQSPRPTTREETEAFLRKHAAFFEFDGRAHIWVMSLPDKATLIYDNHDVLYAYGPIDKFTKVLERRGLTFGDVRYPVPHTHRYNPECDSGEEMVMKEWEWKWFPLQPNDDP